MLTKLSFVETEFHRNVIFYIYNSPYLLMLFRKDNFAITEHHYKKIIVFQTQVWKRPYWNSLNQVTCSQSVVTKQYSQNTKDNKYQEDSNAFNRNYN